jgi:serine protease Do
MSKTFAILAMLFGVAISPLYPQESQRAPSIYERHSESVVLLLVRDLNGKDVALGSAFWVAPKLLVTNAHIVDAGRIYVQIGPVRLPCSVKATDHKNDLAILSVDVEIDATPLKLSSVVPKPGEPVFVIGNPEGLEKAISQGIVSGIRKFESRDLIQITAPISHGSSGGPVFDAQGDVVGVTVGMLESGQNLNFAIPASLVAELLTDKHTADTKGVAAERITELQSACTKIGSLSYSDSADSDYQQTLQSIRSLARLALDGTGNDADSLLRISQLTVWIDTDSSLKAARRACSLRPTVDTHLALVKALQASCILGAESDKSAVFGEAELHASSAVSLSAKSPRYDALYALGDVQEDLGKLLLSEQNLRKALQLAQTNEEKGHASRSLARVSRAEGKNQEAEQFFQKLVNTGTASAYDWSEEGRYLADIRQYRQAGDAYSNSAAGGYSRKRCDAALQYFFAGEEDLTLAASRQCITENTGEERNRHRCLHGPRTFGRSAEWSWPLYRSARTCGGGDEHQSRECRSFQ